MWSLCLYLKVAEAEKVESNCLCVRQLGRKQGFVLLCASVCLCSVSFCAYHNITAGYEVREPVFICLLSRSPYAGHSACGSFNLSLEPIVTGKDLIGVKQLAG